MLISTTRYGRRDNNDAGTDHPPHIAPRGHCDHDGSRCIAVFRSAWTVHDRDRTRKLCDSFLRGVRGLAVYAVPRTGRRGRRSAADHAVARDIAAGGMAGKTADLLLSDARQSQGRTGTGGTPPLCSGIPAVFSADQPAGADAAGSRAGSAAAPGICCGGGCPSGGEHQRAQAAGIRTADHSYALETGGHAARGRGAALCIRKLSVPPVQKVPRQDLYQISGGAAADARGSRPAERSVRHRNRIPQRLQER